MLQLDDLGQIICHICCVFSLCVFSSLCDFSLCFLFVFSLCVFSLSVLSVCVSYQASPFPALPKTIDFEV